VVPVPPSAPALPPPPLAPAPALPSAAPALPPDPPDPPPPALDPPDPAPLPLAPDPPRSGRPASVVVPPLPPVAPPLPPVLPPPPPVAPPEPPVLAPPVLLPPVLLPPVPPIALAPLEPAPPPCELPADPADPWRGGLSTELQAPIAAAIRVRTTTELVVRRPLLLIFDLRLSTRSPHASRELGRPIHVLCRVAVTPYRHSVHPLQHPELRDCNRVRESPTTKSSARGS
jgi:hypothetical protein